MGGLFSSESEDEEEETKDEQNKESTSQPSGVENTGAVNKRTNTRTQDRKPAETPIQNFCVRCGNVWENNFRGIIGFIVPAVSLPWLMKWRENDQYTIVVWLWTFWTLLLQPVNVPVSGLIPLFAFPWLGVISNGYVCNIYFTHGIAFFIVGGYVQMLLNNSDFDRRIMLWLVCPKKDAVTLGKIGFVVKSSIAAYLTSMLSNRLIATNKLMEHVTVPLLAYKSPCKLLTFISITRETTEIYLELLKLPSFFQLRLVEKLEKTEGEISYNSFRYILANSIATSSAIGSIGIVHSSYSIMAFRAMYAFHIKHEVDDFNFLQYSLFAFPTSLVMFVFNLLYNIALVAMVCKGEIEKSKVIAIRDTLNNAKDEFKKNKAERILHEVLTIFFLILVLMAYFTRWNVLLKGGWSSFKRVLNKPLILDVTVASIFAILLHIIPRTYNFLSYFKPNKWTKSTMPKVKPESAILFWKLVDKNTNYGYIMLFGAGVAISYAVKITHLNIDVRTWGRFLTEMKWEVGMLLICLFSVFLSNIMSSCGALVMIQPFLENMTPIATETDGDTTKMWIKRAMLGPLAAGIAVNFGFAAQFMFTPSYFSKTIAKVPLLKQMKYSIGSILICFFICWLMVAFFAPAVFIYDWKLDEDKTFVF